MNKFLLVGNKFLIEIDSRKPRFFYGTCGPFTKNKEQMQVFKGTGDSRYLHPNELDKECSQP